jgi:copper chaperone CopZ
MSITFQKFTAALIAVTATTAIATSAQAATAIKANVNGMVCAFCAQGIEKRLLKLSSTKEVFVDLKKRVVAVEAKEGETLDIKLVTAEIVDAGYDVTKVEVVPQSVADIRSETKAKK